jgi:DNA-binding SARP family transcriptional activator
MDFRILGPLEVDDGDHPLALGGSRQRALLGLLLLHAGEVVSSDRLVDEIWGDKGLREGSKALHVAVSRLRKVVGSDVLVTRPPGYELRVKPGQLDLQRFEGLVEGGRKALAEGDPATAADSYREALVLWRGPPLADLAYESFAQTEIARLEELRMAALEQRIEADLQLGRHADLIGELEALVAQHPLRERLRRQSMVALYRSGRQAEALEAYRETRRALVDELGIEPSAELQELEAAILRQDPGLQLAAPVEPARDEPRGVFVGRKQELAELIARFEDAAAGRGRLVLLVGEPGIGKSRLAEELAGHARSRDAGVLVGRCWEAGGAPAYWPWVQALRSYARESDPAALRAQLGAGARDLAQIVPELHHQIPGLPEPHPVESEGARFRLFDAVLEFLRNAAESRSLVLLLDDLHAADAPSLLLLRFLARELGSTRLLLIGAYRDVAPLPGEPLMQTLAEVVREPVTRRISLGGLSETEVGEYVELAAPEIATEELPAALYEETEGNPLFVGEMVRLLSAEGVRSEPAAEVRLDIPQSVRDVIVRRLAHLSEECNRVLVLASVLGREFGIEAIARMAGASEDELLETIDEAMAARVIADTPGVAGRLRFAHVLIRDTLYEGLTAARRVRLHRLALEALEAVYGEEPGPYLAELANQAIAGSDFDKGLLYARRAGDRGLSHLAYEESARLYEAALDALEHTRAPNKRTRCELLLSLGEGEARAGETPVAKAAFLEAAGIARRLGLARELALAAAGYGGRIVWARAGDDDRLVPLLEEALAAVPEEEVELRARLLARLAGALRDEHSRDRRVRLSADAVELARLSGNPAALAYALDGRAAVIVGPDTVAECLAIGSELCEVAESHGDTERVMAGHSHRFIALLQFGDVPGAEADLAAANRLAHELGQPAQLWQYGASRALLALAAGELDEAEDLVPRALALGERAQPTAAIPVHALQRYTLCDFRGRLEELEPTVHPLVAGYPARVVFRCLLAHLHAKLGRTDEARQALDELSAENFAALPFDQEWLYGMSLLAETAALLDDADSAAVLYGLLAPWAELNVVDVGEGMRGSVSRYLGLLASAMSRWDAAGAHFEVGIAMNERMGARPWVAHTKSDYAATLLARHVPGDRERARKLLDAALSTYRELGMESYAAAASALGQELAAAQ